MSEPPAHRIKTTTVAAWLVLFVCFVLLAVMVMQGWKNIKDMADSDALANRARSIKLVLDAWAADHSGQYPDTVHGLRTSNQVFRQLFKDDFINDERIFGGMLSPFIADGMTGSPPGYLDACGPGENHWMLLRGVRRSDQMKTPVIFENALDNSWPPKWRTDAEMQPMRGRTWLRGKIVMAIQDGSVSTHQLIKVGDHYTLPASMLQTPEEAAVETFEILDIEEKK